MSKVNVFSSDGKPQHLAIPNERIGNEMPSHRAVCNADTDSMPVVSVCADHLTLPCGECQEQLSLWQKVIAS